MVLIFCGVFFLIYYALQCIEHCLDICFTRFDIEVSNFCQSGIRVSNNVSKRQKFLSLIS